jgi:hypothetical protein
MPYCLGNNDKKEMTLYTISTHALLIKSTDVEPVAMEGWLYLANQLFIVKQWSVEWAAIIW